MADGTRPSEGRGPGSIPGEDIAPSKERVEALSTEHSTAPEPDGRAAVCKTAEAGSTPAGASLFETGSFSRPMAMIQEVVSDDVIWAPSTVNGPAVPGKLGV